MSKIAIVSNDAKNPDNQTQLFTDLKTLAFIERSKHNDNI